MPDTPQVAKPVSRMATILKGEVVAVELLDGTKFNVFVRQLPARILLTDFMQWLVMGREWEIIGKVCKNIPGEPELEEGWVDALTDESHRTLIEKAKALNFTRAGEQIARTARDEKEILGLEKILPQPSPTSSPTPP